MTLTVEEGKALVTEFCATYPIAAGISYKLRETQEELYGPQATKTAVGKILGAFRPGRGQADFATSNFRDADEFKGTLRHEVLGHFGINTFNSVEKRAILDGIIAARLEVLKYDQDAAAHTGQLRAELARLGKQIGPYDQMIAGHGVVLILLASRLHITNVSGSMKSPPNCRKSFDGHQSGAI